MTDKTTAIDPSTVCGYCGRPLPDCECGLIQFDPPIDDREPKHISNDDHKV